MRYEDLSEDAQLRMFVDFVRLCIGLDPLHCRLTYQECVEPLPVEHKMSHSTPVNMAHKTTMEHQAGG